MSADEDTLQGLNEATHPVTQRVDPSHPESPPLSSKQPVGEKHTHETMNELRHQLKS